MMANYQVALNRRHLLQLGLQRGQLSFYGFE
jgi:hypothetical protein